MITFDTRILAVMLTIGCVIFAISRVPFRNVAIPVYLILIFLFLNNVAIFLFSPQEGVEIYGSRTEWLHLVGRYTLTWEQMFYQMNVTSEILDSLADGAPVFGDDPSERICFFPGSHRRQLPDRVRAGHRIALYSGYPKGLSPYSVCPADARARFVTEREVGYTIKNAISIVWPLILSSLDRIEKISAAMELRGFGSQKKRTFYNSRPLATGDYIALALLAVLTFVALYVTFHDGSRFYNPFQ